MTKLIEILLGLEPGKLGGADNLLPHLAADYNNWIILGLSVVFMALVALTVACYLREGDTPRRAKLAIAAVRIAVIVLIFLMLLQPGLILRYKRDLYSSVAVLLDDSLSMAIQDRYADPDARRFLAGKLGVDEAHLATLPRNEIVRRIVGRQGGPLAQLCRDHPLLLMRFPTAHPDRERYTQRLGEVDHVTPSPEEPLPAEVDQKIAAAMADLRSAGFETNLAAALRSAVNEFRGRRVAAIVLVSDGQTTGAGEDAGDRLASAMAYVRQRGITVYAIGVGDPTRPKNVAVLQVQGPAEVRKGSDIELTAYLSHRNCGGRKVALSVWRKKPGDEQWTQATASGNLDPELKVPAEGQQADVQEVVLRTPAGELGEFVYQVRAQPVDGEFSTDDNAADTKIRISDEKIKILLISADAGWEFLYLRNVLLRSEHRYAVSIWQQNAEVKFNQESSSPEMRLSRLPKTREELYKYEVVILYDPAHTENGFDANFVKILEEFVADHHGGLCYIAGNKYSEENLTTRDERFRPLADLLPVELDRQSLDIVRRIASGEPVAWAVLPTGVGLDHPVLRLGPGRTETLNVWKVMPGVYWSHPINRLKPVASELAVSADAVRTTSGDRSAVPIVAVQYYGKGRSLYVGTDETWRWRFLSDGGYYRRFWSNVVDFLASGRLRKKRVIITAGGSRFSIGEELRIRVEAYDRQYRPLEDKTFQVDMINAATKEVVRTIVCEPETRRKPKTNGGEAGTEQVKGRYQVNLPLKTVGTFELTAKRDDPTYKGEVSEKTITVALPQEEFRHPEASPETLRGIAPEGRFMDIADSDRLAKLVPPGKMTVYHDVPHDLWDVPLAIILIVTLLAIEWILRKRYNMA